MNGERAAPADEIQIACYQPNHGANDSDGEVKAKAENDEDQAAVEGARSRSILRRQRRMRRHLLPSQLGFGDRLDSFKPLANLNVVVTADVQEHKARRARAPNT